MKYLINNFLQYTRKIIGISYSPPRNTKDNSPRGGTEPMGAGNFDTAANIAKTNSNSSHNKKFQLNVAKISMRVETAHIKKLTPPKTTILKIFARPSRISYVTH